MRYREELLKNIENGILPKRIKQHSQELQSYNIFIEKMPKSWIIRAVTERDYGIDLLIEIVQDNKITGRLFTCQLKSILKINKQLKCSGIKPSTFNYWYLLPTTTFVFFVDIENREVYFTNIKKYIRQNYKKFRNMELKSISFNKKLSLSNMPIDKIENELIDYYDRENSLQYIEFLIISFILNFEKNNEVLVNHLYQDAFLALNDINFDDAELIVLYNSFEKLSSFFYLNWNLPSLIEYYKEGHEQFKDRPNAIFFEAQVSKMSRLLIQKRGEILYAIKNYITIYKDYWDDEYYDLSFLINEKFESLEKLHLDTINDIKLD